MKDILKNYCCVALNRTVNLMELFLSEPQVMYPRVACILLETYGDQAPMVIKTVVQPMMSFTGTEETTDYAVVTIFVMVNFCVILIVLYDLIDH